MTPHPLRNRYVRDVFRRKAHAAAMERAIASLMRQTPMGLDQIGRLTLRDLPEGKAKAALLRRRFDIGLSNCPNSRVLVVDAESAGALNTRTPSTLAP